MLGAQLLKLFRLSLLILIGLGLSVFALLNHEQIKRAMQSQYGQAGLIKLHAWEQTLDQLQPKLDQEKIIGVNQFFNNNTRFEDDIVHWKQSDYWATPLETLGSGAGDCEDFAIAKYQTLLLLGIPSNQLRLIYVKAQIGGPQSRVFQAHMVLGYYASPNAVPLILDSLTSSVEPATQRKDLIPVFSFNGEGLWVGSQAQPNADPTARLSRWRDLLERMRKEGF